MNKTIHILIIALIAMSHFKMTGFVVEAKSVFYSLVVLLSVFTFANFWKNKKPLKTNVAEIALLLFVLYLFVHNLYKGVLWGNERLIDTLVIYALYFVFLYNNYQNLYKSLYYGILSGILIELFFGFGQLFEIFPNSDSKFAIGGLFGNPGAFSGHLSIVFPFLLVSVLEFKKMFKSENFHYLLVFLVVAVLSLIIVCDSRGAWIATIAGSIFVLSYKYNLSKGLKSFFKSGFSKIVSGFLLLVIMGVVSMKLYNYKQKSADGRLFIWKTSIPMLFEKPIFGKGFGAFENEYGKAQANYFMHGDFLEAEKQVADYVTSAYNEFLEIGIESGVVGVLLFLVLFYFVFARRYSNNKSTYNIAAKASLLVLFVLCQVSYPFRYSSNTFVFVICLFLVYRTGNYKVIKTSKFLIVISSIWFVSMAVLLYSGSRYITGIYYFKKGYVHILKKEFDAGIVLYKKALPYLSDNNKFLFYNGAALYLNKEFEESIPFLEKATSQSSMPNAFITLGNSLKELKRYEESEHAYLIAAGITPSKLYPRYLLAKLFEESGQRDKAIKIAQEILNSKEKVKTTAGTDIKNEMKILIDQYNKEVFNP